MQLSPNADADKFLQFETGEILFQISLIVLLSKDNIM